MQVSGPVAPTALLAAMRRFIYRGAFRPPGRARVTLLRSALLLAAQLVVEGAQRCVELAIDSRASFLGCARIPCPRSIRIGTAILAR